MRNLSRNAVFIVETRQCGLVAGRAFGQELQRYGLAQLQIGRPMHFAHSASAQQGDDPVAIQQ